ncbi:MAG TPA: thiamine pyrophosphate-binding protein, partial [Nitrospira sp.]|nr:thiamine pyrophosphate-binding protein [Nitrospira sp.]
MANTVADLLVERLIDWGVDTVFSLPGDGINGIYEALRTRQDRIKLILVRHEESAAFAACGYAKFTRRLGVCLATSGPGGIHLLNGLYDAKCDGQPVLAITGHTFHDLIGTHYQQDVDLNKLFGDVAAYSERVMSAAHVGNVLDSAIKTAIARRTVAHVTIPKDIQDWSMQDDGRSKANIPRHSGDLYSDPLPLPSQRLIGKAAALIESGHKIAILAGRGCLGAKSEILELAELLGAPIVKPLLGKGLVPDDHPLTTGGIGLLGTAPSQEVLEECDTLIIAGSSFPYLEFYPKPGQARAVQIDLDAGRIGLRYPVEVGLVGHCWDVLRALLPLLQRKSDRRFLEAAQQKMKQWNELMEERGTR